MYTTLEEIIHFFNFIGSIVCHQRPERTFVIGGQLLPVCARDTGGYLGLLVGYVVLLFRRNKSKGPPSLWMTLLLSMPLIIDVATQTLGFRESNNSLRLLTGLFFGVTVLPFLMYVIPLVPSLRDLPIFSSLTPKDVQIDDVKNSWVTSKALFFGAFICLGIYLAVEYAATSPNPYLYWVITLPVIGSLLFHMFLLPLLVFSSLIYRLVRSRVAGE
jgi:uncharacterized membrane protein